MNKCEFCGKDLQPVEVEVFGKMVNIGYEPCDCSQATAHRAEIVAEAEAEKRNVYNQRFYAKLEKAGIAPRYHSLVSPDKSKTDKFQNWKKGFYIVGDVGTGKTMLAAQFIGRAILDGCKDARFVSSVNLLGELRDTFNGHGSEAAVIKKYGKDSTLLVIDDLGKDVPTPWAVMVIYRIINERYEQMLPTIITTQYKRADLAKRLGEADPETSKAIISRLYEMCADINLSGKDFRKKKGGK